MSARPEEDDTEHQAFLPRTIEEARKSRSSSEFSDKYTSSDPTPRPWTIMRQYLRLAMEIGMAITILLLVGRVVYDKKSSHSSPIPDFPRKTYTFTENPKYLNESMFSSQDATVRTLHNWLELSAVGRGYVKIANYETFDLGEPYTIDVHAHQEPAYMMSVFHQLHCLSYLVQAYQTAFDGAELTHELAHHSTHCFDYLRQSIMCNADTTLEGKTEFGPGWGSRHQCRDYEALLAWANEHSATAWRANMVDTAVL